MLLDLGFLLLLTAWSLGVGRRILRAFGEVPEDPHDALALSLPLGLGLLALATLGLGELGSLDRRALCVLGVVGIVLGAREGWRGVASLVRSRPSRTHARLAWDLALGVLLSVALIGTLLTALAPVTDGDALCYHLQVPKVFLSHAAVGFDPDLHETVYPLATEMLYALALALRGPIACRLVQWGLGIVLAANVTALARPNLGRDAWWAGAIALLAPAVSNGMGAPLNDVSLAAFGAAALVAWSRFHDRPGPARALLAGVFAGLALGVKYPALVLSGILAVVIAARPVLGPRTGAVGASRRSVAWVLGFGLTALLVGGPWYFRAWIHTGNPVHPFFRHLFGGAGLDEVLDPIKRPMAVTPWNLLTALAPLTLQPDRFDSLSHQFGPVFLLFLPAILLEKAPRRVLGVAAIGYAFLALCLTQRQSMRFVLAALGPLSVAVAWQARTWIERRTWPSRVLLVVLLVALAFESALAMARARHGLKVVLGLESPSHYLWRREPTYRVGTWVEAGLPRDARLVGQDHRGFYIPRPYTMELAHRRRTGLGQQGESPERIVEELRGRGFTHLLLCPPVPESAVEFDPTLGRLLAPWLDARVPLFDREIVDADGVTRRYSIYELSGALAGPVEDERRARR